MYFLLPGKNSFSRCQTMFLLCELCCKGIFLNIPLTLWNDKSLWIILFFSWTALSRMHEIIFLKQGCHRLCSLDKVSVKFSLNLLAIIRLFFKFKNSKKTKTQNLHVALSLIEMLRTWSYCLLKLLSKAL